MKVSKKNVIGSALLVLLMILSVSTDVLGQGRGRRAGGRVSQMDRKCGKFVNCHDARDGRWDGRGPRRDVSLTDRIFGRRRRNRDRDDDLERIIRRRRNRDRDDDFERTTRRRRNRDRDFDRDDVWRGRRF